MNHMKPHAAATATMDRRCTSVRRTYSVDMAEDEDGEKIEWPFPVRTGKYTGDDPEMVCINCLQDEAKHKLWRFLRKADPLLASHIQQAAGMKVLIKLRSTGEINQQWLREQRDAASKLKQ